MDHSVRGRGDEGRVEQVGTGREARVDVTVGADEVCVQLTRGEADRLSVARADEVWVAKAAARLAE